MIHSALTGAFADSVHLCELVFSAHWYLWNDRDRTLYGLISTCAVCWSLVRRPVSASWKGSGAFCVWLRVTIAGPVGRKSGPGWNVVADKIKNANRFFFMRLVGGILARSSDSKNSNIRCVTEFKWDVDMTPPHFKMMELHNCLWIIVIKISSNKITKQTWN